MKININKEIQKISDDIYTYRRDFHQNPELSFQEYRTAETISKYLDSFGITHKTNIGETGIVGEIDFGEGPTIALRADMDALPIQEIGDLEYKSKNEGVMHACGHDGHMAILLGAANVLSKNKKIKKGKIRFIFQPAEEGGGGARYMIEDGCLEGVDEIYGLHLWNYQPLGEIGVKEGPIMAAADMFDIIVKGKGGHAAMPHLVIDPIIIASQIILSLQTIISRFLDPVDKALISVTKIHGGNAHNVIEDEVFLSGTVRTFKKDTRDNIERKIKETVKGIAKANRGEAEIKYIIMQGHPPHLPPPPPFSTPPPPTTSSNR